MAFPGMLVSAAEKAGMQVPPNPNDFDADAYPHFQVYCNVQLCRPMRSGEHWENAEVVAGIPEDKIRTTTLDEMLSLGLHFQT